MLPLHLVFNSMAGSVLKMGEETLTALIKESGLNYAGIHFLEVEKIGPALQNLKKEGVVLLGGGDGTFMYAAKDFLDAPGRLGILPMGTMNLLARDLKIPVDFKEALKAYAQGTTTKTIDVAMVNDRPFLCFAAMGIVPETAKLREEKREENDLVLIPRLAMFVFPKLDPSQHRTYRLRLSGNRKRNLRASALVISNNLLQEEGTPHAHAFAKKSLHSGILGLYSFAPRSFWDKLRLMLRIKIGHWKDEPMVVERTAVRAELISRRRKESISLDGEPMDLVPPLAFSLQPGALTLCVPAAAVEELAA
jgi:diacylglycerol kinase family enzyme